jgi:cellulose synthase operon protein C
MQRVSRVGVLLAVCAAACAPRSGSGPVEPKALQSVKLEQIELSATRFSQSVADLLRDGEVSAQRLSLLVAAVRWQLGRAGRYFEAGHDEAALDSVLGALLLVRSGELRSEMFKGQGKTLLLAASVLARRGDEGGAQALYELAQPELTRGAMQADVGGHLSALRAWQEQTQAQGSMLEAGARRANLTKRALIHRTPENVKQAQQATAEWVERSFSLGDDERPPTSHDEFDERREVQQARVLGAPTMAALFLRDGDAVGAVAALEGEPMEAVANSKLVSRLSDAADGDAEAWADMFGFFQSPKTVTQMGLDRDVALGAAWGAALALYRVDPSELQASMAVAAMLAEHNMGEVAPLLLDPVLGTEPDVRELSWSLGLLLQSLGHAEQREDLELARRAFSNGERLVKLAASKAYSGRVRPGAQELWQFMGGLESRAGYPEQARQFLQLAAAQSPSSQALRLLAAIDRQKGDFDKALQSLNAMLELTQRSADLGAEAATLVMLYDVQRERGEHADAAHALASALGKALQARGKARSGGQLAAVERVLADVLERYGDRQGANRAVERAEDAARNDQVQLSATVLDAARRALCLRDLEAGRRALRHALDGDLEDADLIYAALWVKLLHSQLKVPSDGSVEEALARVDTDGTWVGVLRDWGRGSVASEQLQARAQGPAQRTEAEFYAALSAHASGSTEATLARLQAVAQSPAVELVEVRIARDLLLTERGATRPQLPPGVEIP